MIQSIKFQNVIKILFCKKISYIPKTLHKLFFFFFQELLVLPPALTSEATNCSLSGVEDSSFTAQSSCVCFGSRLKDITLYKLKEHMKSPVLLSISKEDNTCFTTMKGKYFHSKIRQFFIQDLRHVFLKRYFKGLFKAYSKAI